MEKNDMKNLAVTSFGITFSLFVLLKEKLPEFTTNYYILDTIIEVLIAVGFFTIMFSALLNIFEKIHIRKKRGKISINGIWYQVYLINKYEGNSRIRHGEVKVRIKNNKTEITGSNYRLDGSFSGNWHAQNVTMTAHRIKFDFISNGEKGENRGEMDLTIQGEPPQKISGTFRDVTLNDMYGTIIWFKNEDDYIKYIEEVKEHECSK